MVENEDEKEGRDGAEESGGGVENLSLEEAIGEYIGVLSDSCFSPEFQK